MPSLKNLRHERFAQGLVGGLSGKAAYIAAGYGATGNAAEVSAARLLRNAQVVSRVGELRDEAAIRSETTVDDLVEQLDEMRRMAVELENPSAGVTSIMAKARILGLLTDRTEVTATIRKPASIHTDRQSMTLEEWTARFAPKPTEH